MPREPTEFTIAGVDYRAERMVAMQQAHVARRIGPLIPPLLPLIVRVAAVAEKGGKTSDAAVLAVMTSPEALAPFTEALTRLSNDDFEFVVGACLAVVKRKAGTPTQVAWMPVWNASARRAAFDDMEDLFVLLPLVVRVILDNLKNFSRAFGTSPTNAQTTAA